MKKFTAVFLCILLLCGIFSACSNDDVTSTTANETDNALSYEDESPTDEANTSVTTSFLAEILSITNDSVTVQPDADSWVRSSADKIVFSKAGLKELDVEAGDFVEIVFDGIIMETYPAQINVSFWSLPGDVVTQTTTERPDDVDESEQTDGIVEVQTQAEKPSTEYVPLIITDNKGNTVLKADEAHRKELLSSFGVLVKTEKEPQGNYYGVYMTTEALEETVYTYYPESDVLVCNGNSYKVWEEAKEKLSEFINPPKAGDGAEGYTDGASQYTMMIIEMIYPDCIICTTEFYSPYIYRFNTVLPEEFCLGDKINVEVDGKYKTENKYSSEYGLVEADAISISECYAQLEPGVAYKPVIYLYPEEKTQVSVELNVNGEMLCSYPVYKNGWTVTATPDGTLYDENGKYRYLFWEADLSSVEFDMSEGFCVKGSKTEEFFREKLAYIGLNEREIADYLEFWLPHLTKNAYNYITFQTDCYTDNAKLTVTPTPDSVIRVYTVTVPLDEAIEVTEPTLEHFERNGFTLVEWGGGVVK